MSRKQHRALISAQPVCLADSGILGNGCISRKRALLLFTPQLTLKHNVESGECGFRSHSSLLENRKRLEMCVCIHVCTQIKAARNEEAIKNSRQVLKTREAEADLDQMSNYYGIWIRPLNQTCNNMEHSKALCHLWSSQLPIS